MIDQYLNISTKSNAEIYSCGPLWQLGIPYTYYILTGKFGRELNLAVCQSFSKLPNYSASLWHPYKGYYIT